MNSRSSLLGLMVCLLVGCGNTGAQPQTYEVDGRPVLRTLANDVIVPEHHAFAAASDSLVAALQTLAATPDTASVSAAQAAWREARKAYRHLDALHFGPGYSLFISERIDVTPVDGAGINDLIAGSAPLDDAAVAKLGGKKKGFLGLEYLLFGALGSSSADSPLLEADATVAGRRRALAVSMANEIAASAHQLDDAWDPAKGAYAEQLALAGTSSTQYATQRAAVDDVVGGIGYALELVVGVRLAEPLGKHTGGLPAPEQDPTLRSDNAVADIQASLEGALALYSDQGLAGVVAQKSADLNRVVQSEFAAGQAAVAAIPAPFSDAVSDDTAVVQAAYDATKALKQTWSTDVASALGATVRPSDIDGD